MNNPPEPQKSIWKKSWNSWPIFILLVSAATFLIVFAVGYLVGTGSDWKFLAGVAGPAVVAAIAMALIASSIRWLCSWRNLRKALFALACLVTLIALFYAEEDLRGKWAWNHFKHRWEAKGEHLDLSYFTPPPVPDDQNFALTPIMFSTYGSMLDKTGHEILPRNTNVINRLDLEIYHHTDYSNTPTNGNWARGTLTDLKPWQAYYRTVPTNEDAHATNEFPTSPQPQSPAQDVLLALSKYNSTIEELRQASRMPYSRFPLEYDKDDPAMILLPHLARLKQSVQCLELRAIAELQAGQIDQAAADIKLMCHLTQASQAEPFLITHLVRMAMLNYAIQPIYEGLADHKWSDAQLASMDTDLAKFNFLADYQHSMRSEAAGLVKEIAYIQRTRNVTHYISMFGNDNPWSRVPALDLLCYLAPSGWFHQNQIRFSEFYLQQCLPVVNITQREVSPKSAEQAQSNLDEATAHPRPYNALQSMFYLPVRKWFFDKYVSADKFAFAQESADLARVAVALERYKLAHGDYPESLDALAPQFIPKVPRDIIGEEPLKYRRTDTAFVLYSIGWNEKDDGGVAATAKSNAVELRATLPDPDTGDWVWAYPMK